MSDPWAAEAQPDAEWARMLDGLIDWAIAQADAAVEELCGYLDQRAAELRDPAWMRGSLPCRGRDHSGLSLLRSHQNGTSRQPGDGRAPRRRRMPG